MPSRTARPARGKAALRSAAKEALWRGEPLAVLRIVPGVDKPRTDDPALVEQLTAELAEFPDLTWKLHTGPEGYDTADAVLGLAEEVGASLLVIGSRRRTAGRQADPRFNGPAGAAEVADTGAGGQGFLTL